MEVQVCFVSTDLRADLADARKGTHKLEYVLPDGVNERIGYARQPLGKGERADKNSKEQVRALTRSSLTILVMCAAQHLPMPVAAIVPVGHP
jgi:hypothetical protein